MSRTYTQQAAATKYWREVDKNSTSRQRTSSPPPAQPYASPMHQVDPSSTNQVLAARRKKRQGKGQEPAAFKLGTDSSATSPDPRTSESSWGMPEGSSGTRVESPVPVLPGSGSPMMAATSSSAPATPDQKQKKRGDHPAEETVEVRVMICVVGNDPDGESGATRKECLVIERVNDGLESPQGVPAPPKGSYTWVRRHLGSASSASA